MSRRLAILSLLILTVAAMPAAADEAPLQPTNLTKVNTKEDEVDPYVTLDGLNLLYAANGSGTFNLMLSRRTASSQPWAAGKPFDDLNSKDADTRSPFYTRDGRLYFATNKVPDKKFEDLKNFDILERIAQRAPQPLLQVSTAEDEMFPWVTPSGKEFYFSRKTKEGWRVFVSKGPLFGAIGEGKLIEELPVGFQHTTLTQDALTMYLQGPLDKERSGLFRTTRPKVGGEWAKPEPLSALNSTEAPRGDMSPCLAAGGTILYFVSDRPGGQGGLDLWFIQTAKLAKKK